MGETTTVLERAIKHASRGKDNERGFYGYLDLFDVTKDEIGSLMLDLGSGQEEHVAAEAQREGITVVSFNPALAKKEHRDILKKTPGGHLKRSVAAAAQEPWPFPDDKFDSIFSYQAIPAYLNEEEYQPAFSEIIRTLKPGRRAWLGPVYMADNNHEVYDKALNNLPCSYDFTPVTERLSGKQAETRVGVDGPSFKAFNLVLRKG